jgi:hypothetical protein
VNEVSANNVLFGRSPSRKELACKCPNWRHLAAPEKVYERDVDAQFLGKLQLVSLQEAQRGK